MIKTETRYLYSFGKGMFNIVHKFPILRIGELSCFKVLDFGAGGSLGYHYNYDRYSYKQLSFLEFDNVKWSNSTPPNPGLSTADRLFGTSNRINNLTLMQWSPLCYWGDELFDRKDLVQFKGRDNLKNYYTYIDIQSIGITMHVWSREATMLRGYSHWRDLDAHLVMPNNTTYEGDLFIRMPEIFTTLKNNGSKLERELNEEGKALIAKLILDIKRLQ